MVNNASKLLVVGMIPPSLQALFGASFRSCAEPPATSVLRLGAAANVRLPLVPPPGPVMGAAGTGARVVRRVVRGMRDPAVRHGFERALLLARLGALQQQGDAPYQLLARMAARVCRTPMAAVSLLDDRTHWNQGSFGTPVDTLPLHMSFCRFALGAPGELTVIADTRADPRAAAHPMVMHAPYLRFYAGAPLVHPQGLVLGAVCVLDHRPRQLRPAQVQSLQWLADVAMRTVLRRAPASAPGPMVAAPRPA